MFVTFYSYKGGVGRTLALANIAYLLANEKKNPCKILLWDFDLEAPGLQQIFKIKWRKKKQGFVDLVYEYMTKAYIPKIKEYIHKTDISNVDILPAGHISRDYSIKLEKINWVEIYSKARGYDFLQNLKEQVEKCGYDYILIDSRTGYSDVGNICVGQLPDIAILLFRLNNQNIEGTREVYNIIKANKKQQNKNRVIIPVITPYWPFSENSSEANFQIEKAQTIFQGLKLLKINFDSALTYQEKIICRDIDNSKMKMIPNIYEDYRNLMWNIRLNNPVDSSNIEKQAEVKKKNKEYAEAFKLYQRLVELRSNNGNYWRNLLDTAMLERTKNQELYNQLESIISFFLKKQPKNYLPVFTRAELRSLAAKNKDLDSILQDYNLALKLSKDKTSVLLGRASFYAYRIRNLDKAIEDYNTVILKNINDDQAYYLRGIIYERKKEYAKATEDFLKVLNLNPAALSVYVYLARIQFCTKKYVEAKESIMKYLKISNAKVLYSHIMAALGNKQESLSIVEKNTSFICDLDRIEIYIVNFELTKAEEYIKLILSDEKSVPKRDKIVLNFLYLCIQVLKNEEISLKDFDVLINKEKDVLANLGWSFDEMQIFISNNLEKKLITGEQKTKIEDLIKKIGMYPLVSLEKVIES